VIALRRIVFVLVVLGAQGAIGVVLPAWVSPPDLFLLTALYATTRLTPLWTLFIGYGIGLLQDILGAGMLGFHAAGIMTGVLVAGFVRRGLSSESNLNLAISLFAALVAKWLVFIALGYWTRLEAMTVETLLYRFLPEVATTLVIGPFFYAFYNWAFGRVRGNEDRLL
jgi:rod shape-determining protein MreD